MLFVLIYSSLSLNLQRIGIFSYEDCMKSSWRDLQSFLESNSSKIIKSLKLFAIKVIKKPREEFKSLEFIHSKSLQYKDKSQQDLIKDFICACRGIYSKALEAEGRNFNGFTPAPQSISTSRDRDLQKQTYSIELEEKTESHSESNGKSKITQEILDAYKCTPEQSLSMQHESSIASNEEKIEHSDSMVSFGETNSVGMNKNISNEKIVIFKRGRLDSNSESNPSNEIPRNLKFNRQSKIQNFGINQFDYTKYEHPKCSFALSDQKVKNSEFDSINQHLNSLSINTSLNITSIKKLRSKPGVPCVAITV